MIVRAIKSVLHRVGLDLVRYQPSKVDPVEAAFRCLRKLHDVGGPVDAAEIRFLQYCCAKLGESRSQLFQDLFVLFHLQEKRAGYFVEFGACDGITLSNTYLLEKEFGWHGIVAEPAKFWHGQLQQNRRCLIERRCVWSRSGEILEFNETQVRELSTINAFLNHDGRADRGVRSRGELYLVKTVSLNDLLAEHGAPEKFDYLSIDTEGSELSILRNFDFGRWRPEVITVEHNYVQPTREDIRALMSANGYSPVFSKFSTIDDWYVRSAH